MSYTANDPEIDEHTLDRMRNWLAGPTAGGIEWMDGADDDEVLSTIEEAYGYGVEGFLADLRAGNGELP